MKSRFDQVIVIGCGKIARDVVRHVSGFQESYGYKTVFIEHETQGLSNNKAACARLGVAYAEIRDKNELTCRLSAITTPTLIISAGNYYLFPKAVTERGCLVIINFHNALLPKYPGRNAQSWAIYAGETVTGATWHYVTAGIDRGRIIAQGATPISEDTKAYELTRSIMDKAFELFSAFFEELLVRDIKGRPQLEIEGERKVYYSWEIPGGGKCSLKDSPGDIYRLLRATDYGKGGIFPPIKIILTDGSCVLAQRYALMAENALPMGQDVYVDTVNSKIYLPMKNRTVLLINYKHNENQ